MLVLLVDSGPDGMNGSHLYDYLGATLAPRWRLSGHGDHRGHRWDVTLEAHHARARLRALGLLEQPQERFHVALTEDAGLTGALLALRARLERAYDTAGPPECSPFMAWAIAEGFDPTDERSLDAAGERFNSLSFEERGRILGLE